jgi:phage FluMu gp28-like protein
MLLCSRESGKSQVGAAIALQTVFFRPGSLTLLLSPTQRQSGELDKDKLLRVYNSLGRPVPAANETALTLTLANGSRIVSLPGEEGTVRCYSGVGLLVIDEVSKVPDSLYLTVRPMVAASRGRIIVMSTPAGKRGWFYESWQSAEKWHRTRITAEQCPRIPADFLADERVALGPRWFAQEYCCSFEDMIGAVFSHEDIEAAMSADVKPLTFGGSPR